MMSPRLRLPTETIAERFGKWLPLPSVHAGGPPWLTGELCATEAALEKLETWFRTTPRPWLPSEPASVLVKLHAYGDPILPHLLARTLCKLPRVVTDYVVGNVTWVLVGGQFAGWCGAPADRSDRPWEVVLGYSSASSGDDNFERLAVHETAHAWLMPEPPPGAHSMSAFQRSTVHDLSLDRVPKSAIAAVLAARRQVEKDEQQARALVKAWGFEDVT